MPLRVRKAAATKGEDAALKAAALHLNLGQGAGATGALGVGALVRRGKADPSPRQNTAGIRDDRVRAVRPRGRRFGSAATGRCETAIGRAGYRWSSRRLRRSGIAAAASAVMCCIGGGAQNEWSACHYLMHNAAAHVRSRTARLRVPSKCLPGRSGAHFDFAWRDVSLHHA